MPLYTDAQLLQQLRDIGWTDSDIARDYPDLLPYYFTGEPTTLYQRLLLVGWSEERIREEHPELLPASEGGILETVGSPVYTLPGQDGLPGEPIPSEQATPGGSLLDEDIWLQRGTVYDPDYDPNVNPTVRTEPPSVESRQTADLAILSLFLL